MINDNSILVAVSCTTGATTVRTGVSRKRVYRLVLFIIIIIISRFAWPPAPLDPHRHKAVPPVRATRAAPLVSSRACPLTSRSKVRQGGGGGRVMGGGCGVACGAIH